MNKYKFEVLRGCLNILYKISDNEKNSYKIFIYVF